MKNLKLSLFLTALFILIFPLSTIGIENTEVQKIQLSNTNQNLNNGYEIKVDNNDEKSTLTILHNQKSLFKTTEFFQYFQNAYFWTAQDIQYVLVEQRVYGSGAALKFLLLKINSDNVEVVQTSNEYIKGQLILSNDLQLEINYPQYKETDNLATPSQIMKDIYSFNGNTFTINDTKDITNTISNEEKDQSFSFQAQYIADIKGTNPSPTVINELLTRKAIENGIPPEILKAIAWQESGWQQFRLNDNGSFWSKNDVVIGSDGLGIGIMQISIPNLSLNDELLYKSNIEANIDKGIEILLDKWGYGGKTDGTNLLIPTINSNNKNILEDWYFAIMAYNGITKVNDPNNPTYKPYQELIYQHIQNYGNFSTTPFPSSLLVGNTYYKTGSSRLFFTRSNYQITGPFHETSHKFLKNDVVVVEQNQIPLLTSPDGGMVRLLQKGEILQVTGPYKYANDRLKHSVYYPVKFFNDSQTYYVPSGSIKKIDINEFRTDLGGYDRYSTSVEISKNGWSNQTEAVVLGRGDISIDALTGSVLAKKYNSPLLLVQSNSLPDSVEKELQRLSPKKIFILGGTSAISKELENSLKAKFSGSEIIRINGSGRYSTAIEVAKSIGSSNELFITTDNDQSPDSLAAGPVAATKQAPILLATKEGLTEDTLTYIKSQKLSKVYLIGEKDVVPEKVVAQLKNIGIAESAIVRVAGSDRYRTSINIAEYFGLKKDHIIFANGEQFIDALPGTPFAAKIGAPIILTKANETPYVVSNWLQSKVLTVPHFYFLGGDIAISQSNRTKIQTLILERY